MFDMENIALMVINITFTLIALITYYNLFFERKPWQYHFLIPLLLIVPWQVIVTLNPPNILVIIAINLFIYTLLVMWIYQGNFMLKVIFGILYIVIWILIEFLVAYLFMVLDIELLEISFWGSIYSKLLLLGTIVLIQSVKDKNVGFPYVRKYTWLLTGIPILSLLFTNVIYYYNRQEETKIGISLSLCLMAVLVTINISVFKVYQLLAKAAQMEIRSVVYEEQLRITSNYRQDLECILQDSRKRVHDLKNQLIAVCGYIQGNQLKEASEVLEHIIDSDVYDRGITNSGHIPIDSIVNTKYARMKNQGIEFAVEVVVPSVIHILGTDLSALLGNILDNAIEANEKDIIGERFVRLSMRYESGCLILSCVNSFDGMVQMDKKKQLVTRKDDKNNHGIGLYSIGKICEKYEGTATYSYADYTFTIKCVLFEMM